LRPRTASSALTSAALRRAIPEAVAGQPVQEFFFHAEAASPGRIVGHPGFGSYPFWYFWRNIK